MYASFLRIRAPCLQPFYKAVKAIDPYQRISEEGEQGVYSGTISWSFRLIAGASNRSAASFNSLSCASSRADHSRRDGRDRLTVGAKDHDLFVFRRNDPFPHGDQFLVEFFTIPEGR